MDRGMLFHAKKIRGKIGWGVYYLGSVIKVANNMPSWIDQETIFN